MNYKIYQFARVTVTSLGCHGTLSHAKQRLTAAIRCRACSGGYCDIMGEIPLTYRYYSVCLT
jgi:hypothetical protein